MSNRRRGSGEGTIRKRADGRWEARVALGSVSGREKSKSIYGRTRRDVADKLRSAQTAADQGTLIADERLTLNDWFKHWTDTVLVNRVANGSLSESTRNNYKDTVRLHLTPIVGRIRVTRLEPSDVDSLIAAKRADGYSSNSLRLIRSTLRKALQDAMKTGLVSRNVVALSEPIHVTRRAPQWLSKQDARNLLQEVSGDRLEALYVVMLSLGLRRGEALGLWWSDIDFGHETVRIGRSLKWVKCTPDAAGQYPNGRRTKPDFGSPKTAESWRTQNLPAPCRQALLAHRRRQRLERQAIGSWSDDELVFTTPVGTPIDPANFAKAFKAHCIRAGLGNRNLHQLRHSAATLLLAQDLPLHEVSEFLGHTSITITKDVYGHLAPELRKAAADAMESALWGPAADERRAS